MEGILLIAYLCARAGENELLLLNFLPVLLKTVFAYSIYIVTMITSLIQSLINSFDISSF